MLVKIPFLLLIKFSIGLYWLLNKRYVVDSSLYLYKINLVLISLLAFAIEQKSIFDLLVAFLFFVLLVLPNSYDKVDFGGCKRLGVKLIEVELMNW